TGRSDLQVRPVFLCLSVTAAPGSWEFELCGRSQRGDGTPSAEQTEAPRTVKNRPRKTARFRVSAGVSRNMGDCVLRTCANYSWTFAPLQVTRWPIRL